MLKEHGNVLAKMKEDIKLFGFKASDFKGVILHVRNVVQRLRKFSKSKP